jgi:hypothetical protein
MQLGKVLISFGIAIVLAMGINLFSSGQAYAQSFQCPSNPKIGDSCTQRVTIRLRKVESEGRDEFNQRFEPDAGWAVEDCDTRTGERKRTGEVSGPSCVKVQAGNSLTSTSFVDTEVKKLAEHMEKLRIKFGQLPIFADIESRARNEFSSVQQSFQGIQTSNSGANISAWVAVRGGCKNSSPFGCVNWGPGGSLDTDVIVKLRYVGTNQDVSRILEKYIAEANGAAQTSGGNTSGNPTSSSGERFVVDSLSGKCIDVAGAPGNASGAVLQLWDCETSGLNRDNGSPTDQRWTLGGDGFIRNTSSGKCIDVAGAPGNANGAVLQLWDCETSGFNSDNGSPTDQKWRLQ